jgi:hypothetical protein
MADRTALHPDGGGQRGLRQASVASGEADSCVWRHGLVEEGNWTTGNQLIGTILRLLPFFTLRAKFKCDVRFW